MGTVASPRVLAVAGCARIIRAGGSDQLQFLRNELWLPARSLVGITQREARDGERAWDTVRQLNREAAHGR
jgi:hypothetical protein